MTGSRLLRPNSEDLQLLLAQAPEVLLGGARREPQVKDRLAVRLEISERLKRRQQPRADSAHRLVAIGKDVLAVSAAGYDCGLRHPQLTHIAVADLLFHEGCAARPPQQGMGSELSRTRERR